MIYLDYNATAPLRPGVSAAIGGLGEVPLNPSSIHAAGRQAKKLLEDARTSIAQALGAFQNEVLFVSSGSEANNMVLRAFADSHALLVSAIEHASIAKTASRLGASVIPVDGHGVVDLVALDAMLASFHSPHAGESTRSFSAAVGGNPAHTYPPTDVQEHIPLPLKGGAKKMLLSVMLANNETGVIQPIAEIVKIARAHGALVHCDAVQGLGKITLDWGLLGADMLTVSSHKVGGPVGAAALLIRNDLPIRPLITGGGQELGRRAGTEDVRAIVGFVQAVKEVSHCPEAETWLEWREWLQSEMIAAGATIFGLNAARLPQTICVSMPGVKSETQLMHFDLKGYAVSAGSACSSGRVAASHVLQAMGVAPEIAETAIRISWGWGTTKAEIEAFAAEWKQAQLRMSRKVA